MLPKSIQKENMMETYYLNTLIFFFKTQRQLGFPAIITVLDLIDNEEIFDDKKGDMIINILRLYGLNETTHKNGAFMPTPMQLPADDPLAKAKIDAVPMDVAEIPILNGHMIGARILLN